RGALDGLVEELQTVARAGALAGGDGALARAHAVVPQPGEQGEREESGDVPIHYACRRAIHSATSTGLSAPSSSTATFQTICAPRSISSAEARLKRARTREPAGTGPVKRTRFRP